MKKFSYLMVIMLLFVTTNVYAIANDGMLYEVFWKEAGVNVFASDETYHSFDYNGWFIKSTVDSYIYYCIEPESYMQNKNDAISSSHIKITSDGEITSIANLSPEQLERVKLLAYYGYNYKDHTDKKWYGITQVMIWRTIRSDVNWVFKDSRYGNINDTLYDSEIDEMEDLIKNHGIMPSFDHEVVSLEESEQLILTDTNNVLSNFVVDDNEYATFSIDDNKLIITGIKEGSFDVSLKKDIVGNEFSLFTSTSFQDLIARGNVLISDAFLNINVKHKRVEGKLKVIKTDSITKVPLAFATFEIYEKDTTELIFLGDSDENGEIYIDGILEGTYYLKETKAPYGYEVNPAIIEFSINDEVLVTLNITNDHVDNPQTSDKITNYIVLGSMGLFSLASVFAVRKKYRNL